MDETSEQTTSPHQLTAAEANQLAQQLNEGTALEGEITFGGSSDTAARPVSQAAASQSGVTSAAAANEGYDPLEGEEREDVANVFPPDIQPTVEIGGSVEDQGTLRDEYRPGS